MERVLLVLVHFSSHRTCHVLVIGPTWQRGSPTDTTSSVKRVIWGLPFILFLLTRMDDVFSCGGECPKASFGSQRALGRHRASCQIYQASLCSSMQRRRERLGRINTPGYRANKHKMHAMSSTGGVSTDFSSTIDSEVVVSHRSLCSLA